MKSDITHTMKSIVCKLGVIIALGRMLITPCEAQDSFQIYQDGTSATAATLSPGSLLTLDVVATAITVNLDSFTYRISFPNQLFTLTANAFTAPFDNTLAPGGNNGSIPWSGLPLLITDNADAGSPGFTLGVADLYRTTATTTGTGVTGTPFILETLTLEVPSPAVQTIYPISLDVLEAADNTGTLYSTTSGADFMLTVTPVPEPTTPVLLAGAVTLWVLLRGFVKRDSADALD